MSIEVARVLQLAKRRISDPKFWTIGASARSACGSAVTARDAVAKSWCSIGAVQSALPEGDPLMYVSLDTLRGVVGHSIADWNDAEERTHAEVMAAFNKAIKRAAGSWYVVKDGMFGSSQYLPETGKKWSDDLKTAAVFLTKEEARKHEWCSSKDMVVKVTLKRKGDVK